MVTNWNHELTSILKGVIPMSDVIKEIADKYQEFFNFLTQEHNITATISEMDEILSESKKLSSLLESENKCNCKFPIRIYVDKNICLDCSKPNDIFEIENLKKIITNQALRIEYYER